jgi:hypothetical protein
MLYYFFVHIVDDIMCFLLDCAGAMVCCYL